MTANKNFIVRAIVQVDVFTVIEAEDKEKAVAIAEQAAPGDLNWRTSMDNTATFINGLGEGDEVYEVHDYENEQRCYQCGASARCRHDRPA